MRGVSGLSIGISAANNTGFSRRKEWWSIGVMEEWRSGSGCDTPFLQPSIARFVCVCGGFRSKFLVRKQCGSLRCVRGERRAVGWEIIRRDRFEAALFVPAAAHLAEPLVNLRRDHAAPCREVVPAVGKAGFESEERVGLRA